MLKVILGLLFPSPYFSQGNNLNLAVRRHTTTPASVVDVRDRTLAGSGFLDLPSSSQLILGRIPSGISLLPKTKNRFYSGSITNLFVDHYPVGLWNATVRFLSPVLLS